MVRTNKNSSLFFVGIILMTSIRPPTNKSIFACDFYRFDHILRHKLTATKLSQPDDLQILITFFSADNYSVTTEDLRHYLNYSTNVMAHKPCIFTWFSNFQFDFIQRYHDTNWQPSKLYFIAFSLYRFICELLNDNQWTKINVP